jgi:hypothetical protein
MIKFIKSLLARRRCEHIRDSGTLVNIGLNKVFHCTKCGKFLDMI